MHKAKTERRLAAVLAADVVGYTRLMGRDEAGTHARLKAIRRELVDPSVKKHCGRVVKSTGDGVLVEFPSAVEAAACAVEVQWAMLDRNAGIPEDKQIVFRVGLNVGDLIIDDGDIFGDGVNVAARLETLCVSGGICISRAVRDQIRDKVPYIFDDLGEQTVKNVARPVRAFQIRLDALESDAPASETDQPTTAHFASGRWLSWKPVTGVAVLVAAVVGTVWWSAGHDGSKQVASTAAVSLTPPSASATLGSPAAAAPRMSIVVLPFANLNQDAEQDYFADAIVGDLTSDLSRISGSFVIARNTAFTYKGKSVDIKQAGRDLGVRYALEGSVQRVSDKVRVNVELIDAQTGGHLWADRFEGDVARLVNLQDDITGRLARRLDLELTDAESRRAQSERPNNPNAVDLTMHGWSVLNQPYSREQLAQSRDLFEQALRIERELPKALVGLAQTLAIEVNSRWSVAPAEQLAKANGAVTQVLLKFPNDAMAHFVKGEILRAGGKDFESAIREYEAAILINPGLAPAYSSLGNAKIRAGRAEEAFAPLQTAIRLSPRDPLMNIWYFNICHAYTHLGRDHDAIEWCRQSVAVSPYWISYIDLASAYAWTGQNAEAHAAVAELLRLMPNYTVDRWTHAGFSDNPVFLVQYERIIEGLRKAGLAEK